MIPRLALAGLIATLEQTVNAGIRAADVKPEQLAPMAGKILKLRIEDLDLDVWLICGKTRWWFATEPQDGSDIELSGNLGSFIETLRAIIKPNRPLVFEGLDIRGNIGVLQTMQNIFQTLNLDWEDVVTKALGPIPAGILVKTLRQLRRQWLISSDSLEFQTKEYIQSEQKTILTSTFYKKGKARVSKLGRQIDRLEARLKRLEI